MYRGQRGLFPGNSARTRAATASAGLLGGGVRQSGPAKALVRAVATIAPDFSEVVSKPIDAPGHTGPAAESPGNFLGIGDRDRQRLSRRSPQLKRPRAEIGLDLRRGTIGVQPHQSGTATAAATKLAVERGEPAAILKKETEISRVGVP